MYKGTRTADDVLEAAGTGPSGAAVVYGVSAWHAIHGRRVEAGALWQRLVEGPDWAPFGVIAAEADLAREKSASRRHVTARAARSGPPLRRQWDRRG